ncbi:ATP-binding cassette sub-family G member 1-like [Sitophilus oryzae]|uniref:ATP-binding cassette sub-family G member 1-like n=1 Tax=Sitophilus oryzae TaxID=7048 RepID=A0A6J2YV84_SITOR|nr:ATP-binding cassette sub-family G member 1-like [Sitophilus oryzae]
MVEAAEEWTPVLRQEVPLRQLNRIARKPPIDIEFQDLTYSVRDSYSGKGWRQLLKSVNGIFRSGELTAIMGPSGAGKSTLLNILAGYVTAGVKGSIKINDRARDMHFFKKMSAYIMQEDIVQPRLTIREAMMFAARLKLGPEIGESEKFSVVEEVIKLLGLEKAMETRSEYLSGGQRKRLAVALELVNNPPVIFLDEPTTGLDNVAIKQCIELLEKITKIGRTVICTIHQPPASLFQNFDQVYVLANGYCVFNGSPSCLVPFLSKANFHCPSTYTPADYIIEIIQSNTETISQLSGGIQNGKTNLLEARNKEPVMRSKSIDMYEIYQDTTPPISSNQDGVFPVSIWGQLVILLSRTFLQMKRNHSLLYIQFIHHLASGLLVGGIFVGLGNDGTQGLALFKYILSVNVFFMYTYVMVPVLMFPLEVKMMKREYFNRWYSLKAYYLAFTISALPLMILLSIMFIMIVYVLSNQPMDLERFAWFTAMGLSIGLCSQGLGFVIGSTFSITNGSVVGSSALAPLLALACYGMGYRAAIEPFMKIMISISYLRFGVVGFSLTLFKNREPLDCDEMYCHYRNTDLLLKDMGMETASSQIQLYAILAYTIFFRILAYCTLKYQLTSELRNKIVYLATKIVRQKE